MYWEDQKPPMAVITAEVCSRNAGGAGRGVIGPGADQEQVRGPPEGAEKARHAAP